MRGFTQSMSAAAIAAARSLAKVAGRDEVFVTGGEAIYAAALPAR